ncbi:hypothetical protein J6590_094091 [Homalodisca vitripennis]|nr:hypothetical protein J6590_094091 [Homalodisca vitripennis]
MDSGGCDRENPKYLPEIPAQAKFLVGGLDVKPGPEILRGGTTLMDCYSKIPCRQSRCQVWT